MSVEGEQQQEIRSEDEAPAPKRRLFLDLSPFRASRNFTYLWVGFAVGGVGSHMTSVAIGVHIYMLTGATQLVALVGVIELVPMIVVGLYGGTLADRFDRKKIAIFSSILTWASTVGLAVAGWCHVEQLWVFYLLATIVTCAATITRATRSALLPTLIPRHLLPAATALNGISNGFSVTLGPMLAGVLIATVGIQWTYTVDAILFTSVFLGIFALPKLLPIGAKRQNAWRSLVEGMRFLSTGPNVRMSFVVDIIAMAFGQPKVLFPALGAIALGGDAVTVGILTASPALGAFLASTFSGWLGSVRWQGIVIVRSIYVYGLTIVVFGAAVLAAAFLYGPEDQAGGEGTVHTGLIAVAAVALIGSGWSDQISAILRNTVMQIAVPDSMRGRMQALFMVVVSGGPRLGDLYIGATVGLLALAFAPIVGMWLPPLLGGTLIIVLVGVLLRSRSGRGFLKFDALNPVA